MKTTSLLLFIISVFTINAQVKPAPAKAALVYGDNMLYANYSFDVDGTDALGNADLVFYNNASIVDDAERGKVVQIIDTDKGYMSATAPLIFDQDSFTFATWYYYDQANITNDIRWSVIFEFNNKADKSKHYYLSPRLWTDQYGMVSNGGSVGGSWINIGSKPHFPTNTWYHIAVTQKDDSVTVFLNGNVYAAKSGVVKPSVFGVDTFFIGTNPLRDFKGMHAKFDDMKFFHKALSAEEIAALAGTIKPMSISITEDSVEINQKVTLSAVVMPDNATDKAVTWSVSDIDGSATIDAITGELSGVSTGKVSVTATNVATGVSGSIELKVYENSVATKNMQNNLEVKVYPNPSSTGFFVECGNSQALTELTLIDVSGKILFSKTISNSMLKIDANEFNAKGVYLLKIQQEGASLVKKIIVD